VRGFDLADVDDGVEFGCQGSRFSCKNDGEPDDLDAPPSRLGERI
jgi:hypothetical protein